MNVDDFKEIINLLNSLGQETKQVILWYFAYKFVLSATTICIVFITITMLYKFIYSIMRLTCLGPKVADILECKSESRWSAWTEDDSVAVLTAVKDLKDNHQDCRTQTNDDLK